MRLKPPLQVLFVASIFLLAATLSLLHVKNVSLAQGGQLTLTKTLNRPSNVVRVGEVLSFTIALTNGAGFTLTNVTLVDVYAHTILGYAGAVPGPDQVTTGVLTWNNVAAVPIPPGQTLTFTVFFTAEHPQTAVVNYVRAQDITGTAQSISSTSATSQTGEVIGGTAPLVKSLFPPDYTPQVGLPLTFTHLITNDGAAIMTRLPLTDTYNPDYLQFHYAVPMPTIITPPGLLVWTDLTTYFGDIPPFGTVVVTTVFTATAEIIDTTVNSASTEGALDQYENDLTGHETQVPITIIGNTPTPRTDESSDDDDDEADTPTPAPTVTPTPGPVITTSEQTDTSFPRYLPETGWFQDGFLAVAILGLILLTFGWYLVRRFDH